MILVLLQNAWSSWYTRIGRPGEVVHTARNKVWAREDWLEATWSSRSGKRLKQVLAGVPEDDIWLDDTTLEVADKPSGVCKPNPDHVAAVLLTVKPTLTLTCGVQAACAMSELVGDQPTCCSTIEMPHPAMRLLTNERCRQINLNVLAHLREPETNFHVRFGPRALISATKGVA